MPIQISTTEKAREPACPQYAATCTIVYGRGGVSLGAGCTLGWLWYCTDRVLVSRGLTSASAVAVY